MGGCVIERTNDHALIREIVTKPEIWATVAEDGFMADEWQPDMGECWLKAQDDSGLIGLFNYHVIDNETLQVHPIVLHEARGKRAIEAGKASMRWIFDNSGYSRIGCLIPSMYRNVKLYAMQCGFRFDHVIENSYQKYGKLYPMWALVAYRGSAL